MNQADRSCIAESIVLRMYAKLIAYQGDYRDYKTDQLEAQINMIANHYINGKAQYQDVERYCKEFILYYKKKAAKSPFAWGIK